MALAIAHDRFTGAASQLGDAPIGHVAHEMAELIQLGAAPALWLGMGGAGGGLEGSATAIWRDVIVETEDNNVATVHLCQLGDLAVGTLPHELAVGLEALVGSRREGRIASLLPGAHRVTWFS
jgi:hypothetical protein